MKCYDDLLSWGTEKKGREKNNRHIRELHQSSNLSFHSTIPFIKRLSRVCCSPFLAYSLLQGDLEKLKKVNYIIEVVQLTERSSMF